MEDWERSLLDGALMELKREEKHLSRLHEGRRGNDLLSWGVAFVFENILVYLVYRGITRKRYFKHWHIIWEDRYSNRKNERRHVDLSFKRKSGKRKHYVEAKWYSAKGVKLDYLKLRKKINKRDVGGLYVMLFDARPKGTRALSLREKVEKLKIMKKGKVTWVRDERKLPTRWFNMKRFGDDRTTGEGIFEVGLLRIEV